MPGHVIVTGATGFIGSHLSTRLLGEGCRLTIVTRHPDSPSARWLASRGARVVTADLTDADALLRAADDEPCDALIHLGASVNLAGDDMRATNVAGTANVLRLAEASRAGYLVFASSIEAQGLARTEELPLDETRACRPPTPYGESKCDGEAQVAAFAERTGIPALVARIGNTYGPGSLGFVHFFLRTLLTDGAAGPALPLLGARLLQPIFVTDLVEALVRALRVKLAGVFNFTGDAPASIGDWVLALAELLGVEELARLRLAPRDEPPPAGATAVAEAVYFLLADGDRIHRGFTDARLRAAIGDYQRHSLHRGLAATLAWYAEAGALQPFLQ